VLARLSETGRVVSRAIGASAAATRP
jgi:hypothetical protein